MSVGFYFDNLQAHVINHHGRQNAFRRPNLNISVHSLWQQRNFRRGLMFGEIDYLPVFGEVGWDDPQGSFPDDLYNRILPALQLATILLEKARPFFMKVIFADLESTPKGLAFAHNYSPTPAQVASYDAKLQKIASSYRIFTEGSIDQLNGNIFGLSQATPDPAFPVIGSLASEFFDALRSPLYDSQTTSAIHCTLLLLAMTCVHELAHVIFMHRSIPQNILKLKLGQQIDPEPFVSVADPVVELGEALEHYLFSGTMHFLGARDDSTLDASGELGLAWAPWISPDPAMTETALLHDAEPLLWAVSTHSISRLLDWTFPFLDPVSIELTPARALSVTVEACEGDLYDTLFLVRLLTVRKRVLLAGQDRGRLDELDVRRPRSPRSGRSASPRSRRSASPRSRQ